MAEPTDITPRKPNSVQALIATIALWPVGRRVVPVEVAQAAREANARRRFQ